MSTQPEEVETWAQLVARIRKKAGLSKAAFARAVGVHVDTIGRWEAGATTPTKSVDVEPFSRNTGVDLTYALRAAGIVAPAHGPAGVPPERDEPGVATIRAASLPEWLKAELIEELKVEAAEDEARRARRAKRMLEVADRRGLNREDGA